MVLEKAAIIFLEIFSGIVIKDYFDNFLEEKCLKRVIVALSWCGFVILASAVIFLNFNTWQNVLVNFSLIMILITILYKGSMTKKSLLVIFFCLIWMIVETIVGYILFSQFPRHNIILVGSFISKLCMFIFVRILNLLWKKDKNFITYKITDWINALVVPVLSVYLIHILYMLSIDTKLDNAVSPVLASISILVINILNLKVYSKLEKDFEVEKQKTLYEQQLELCNKNVEDLQKSYSDFKRVIHDFKHHALYVYELAKRNNQQEICKYIDELIPEFTLNKMISNSGNVVIDTLINYKYAIAIQQEIEFQVYVAPLGSNKFDSGDLCVILGNSLDNAIEACKNVKDRRPSINLSIYYQKGVLSITIKNTCYNEAKKNSLGYFETSKKNKKLHGIGLNSIQNAVDKCNGEMIIESSHTYFQLKILLYKK